MTAPWGIGLASCQGVATKSPADWNLRTFASIQHLAIGESFVTKPDAVTPRSTSDTHQPRWGAATLSEVSPATKAEGNHPTANLNRRATGVKTEGFRLWSRKAVQFHSWLSTYSLFTEDRRVAP